MAVVIVCKGVAGRTSIYAKAAAPTDCRWSGCFCFTCLFIVSFIRFAVIIVPVVIDVVLVLLVLFFVLLLVSVLQVAVVK